MEFAGTAHLAPFASLAAELPWRKASDVRQVQPGAKAGDTAADARQSRDQQASAAVARDITALRQEHERRRLPAGPSPAFQVSLLELQQDIREVIARVEAARTQAREADALKADAVAEERAGVAEVTELEAAATAAATQAATHAATPAATQAATPAATPAATRAATRAGEPPGTTGTVAAAAAAPSLAPSLAPIAAGPTPERAF